MSFSLLWMPKVLLDAGLKVALVDGWETSGRGDMEEIHGVLLHHTAGIKTGNMPSLNTLVRGRPGLIGPLAQLGLGRDGTYYVIAAGRCNHAGEGIWGGITSGNSHFIGIEAENTGLPDDPWPAVQLDAYHRGVAAILKHVGLGVECCAGHKEYAPKRKIDPSVDMNAFRNTVSAILAGTADVPPLIPAAEPPKGATPGRPTLRRGMEGEQVRALQMLLKLPVDGNFGPKTEAAVRALQRSLQMVPDGIVGPKTWAAVDAQARKRVANQ